MESFWNHPDSDSTVTPALLIEVVVVDVVKDVNFDYVDINIDFVLDTIAVNFNAVAEIDFDVVIY